MSEYPEGRAPLTWQDMPFADKPRGHPSTFEAECKQLRARVAELEAALGFYAGQCDEPIGSKCPWHQEAHLCCKTARTALNPPQEPPEATTDPL